MELEVPKFRPIGIAILSVLHLVYGSYIFIQQILWVHRTIELMSHVPNVNVNYVWDSIISGLPGIILGTWFLASGILMWLGKVVGWHLGAVPYLLMFFKQFLSPILAFIILKTTIIPEYTVAVSSPFSYNLMVFFWIVISISLYVYFHWAHVMNFFRIPLTYRRISLVIHSAISLVLFGIIYVWLS